MPGVVSGNDRLQLRVCCFQRLSWNAEHHIIKTKMPPPPPNHGTISAPKPTVEQDLDFWTVLVGSAPRGSSHASESERRWGCSLGGRPPLFSVGGGAARLHITGSGKYCPLSFLCLPKCIARRSCPYQIAGLESAECIRVWVSSWCKTNAAPLGKFLPGF